MRKVGMLSISLIILTIIISCKEGDPYSKKEFTNFSRDDFEKTEVLTSSPTYYLDDSIVVSINMITCGDRLVVLDRKSMKPFHVFSITDKKYIGSFGARGEGPGEIQVPWLLFERYENEFYVYDVGAKKILGYRFDSLEQGNRPFIEKRVFDTRALSSIHIDKSGLYFTDETSNKARLYYEDGDGKLFEFGELLGNNLNASDQNHGILNRVRMAGNNDKIVTSYILAPFFEIFNKKDKTWKSFLGPDRFEPYFKEINVEGYKKFSIDKKNSRLGYINVQVSEKHVYLLYSGGVKSNYPIDAGSEVFVFSLEGNPLKHFRLDKELTTFSVYGDSLLLGLNIDLEAELLTYEID